MIIHEFPVAQSMKISLIANEVTSSSVLKTMKYAAETCLFRNRPYIIINNQILS